MVITSPYKYSPIVHIGVWTNIISGLDIEFLIKHSYLIKEHTPSVNKSNRGPGFQSKDDLDLYPPFQKLAKFLTIEGQKFSKEKNLKLKEMWVNISPPGGSNGLHNHAPGHELTISGVIYLKTPPNCGRISFCNPLNFNSKRNFEVHEGEIFLFDSRLFHSVEPNLSQEDRISIAFNYNM